MQKLAKKEVVFEDGYYGKIIIGLEDGKSIYLKKEETIKDKAQMRKILEKVLKALE
jgi:hypothetical protein